MSYLAKYSEACDYMRKELKLAPTVDLYELVVKMIEKYKDMTLVKMPEDKPNIQSSKGEKKRGRPRKIK